MIRTETSKLRALRSKTDLQLVELIGRLLEMAHAQGRDPASRARAVELYAEVRRLLPMISRLDRRALETRLDEVAAMLYPLPKAAACF